MEYDSAHPMGQILRALRDQSVTVEEIQPESDAIGDARSRGMILSLKPEQRIEHSALLRRIEQIEGVLYLEEL